MEIKRVLTEPIQTKIGVGLIITGLSAGLMLIRLGLIHENKNNLFVAALASKLIYIIFFSFIVRPLLTKLKNTKFPKIKIINIKKKKKIKINTFSSSSLFLLKKATILGLDSSVDQNSGNIDIFRDNQEQYHVFIFISVATGKETISFFFFSFSHTHQTLEK